MEFNKVIKNRFSCKNFSDKKLEDEKLHKILEAGRLAPTAKNLQEQHIYVAQSDPYLKIIDQISPCRYNAPTVLIVTFNTKDVYIYPGGKQSSGVEDTTIVTTQMVLAAEDNKVDSCWVNRFEPEELKKLLNLPEEEEIVCLIDLGYKNKGVTPLKNHYDRKPLSETVTYLR